jgi:hypothetical protein
VWRTIANIFWGLVCVAVLVAVYNTFADSLEVASLAQNAACLDQPAGCSVQGVYLEWNPIARTFNFELASRSYVRVRCTREYVIAGAFTCVNQGAGLPFATGQGSFKPIAPRPSARAAPAPARGRATPEQQRALSTRRVQPPPAAGLPLVSSTASPARIRARSTSDVVALRPGSS